MLVGLLIMVLVIPYAFSSVIKQLQQVSSTICPKSLDPSYVVITCWSYTNLTIQVQLNDNKMSCTRWAPNNFFYLPKNNTVLFLRVKVKDDTNHITFSYTGWSRSLVHFYVINRYNKKVFLDIQ